LSRNVNIDLHYRYDDMTEADSVFAGLAGSRQQIDAHYRWYRDGHGLQLRFGLETNDRLDAGTSPDRNRFGIDYRYQPGHGLGFEAGVDLRNSEYDELATPREEDLTTLRGALTYLFPNNWLVLLEYRNSSNDSTDPLFDYDRGQASLGLQKYF
jgi:opacity protein-like surface antigen